MNSELVRSALARRMRRPEDTAAFEEYISGELPIELEENPYTKTARQFESNQPMSADDLMENPMFEGLMGMGSIGKLKSMLTPEAEALRKIIQRRNMFEEKPGDVLEVQDGSLQDVLDATKDFNKKESYQIYKKLAAEKDRVSDLIKDLYYAENPATKEQIAELEPQLDHIRNYLKDYPTDSWSQLDLKRFDVLKKGKTNSILGKENEIDSLADLVPFGKYPRERIPDQPDVFKNRIEEIKQEMKMEPLNSKESWDRLRKMQKRIDALYKQKIVRIK